MKITSSLIVLLISLAINHLGQIVLVNGELAKPIQIVVPVNHTIRLNFKDLKRILEAEQIKNRHVVVVSMAGAIRQGKSFLMNFFIRYLNAQYKNHDVHNWLKGNGNEQQLNGFKWRNGAKPETFGIWMWSEVFTHDYANGEKVAIILLDTQGIFGHQSSVKDYTTIFAMSLMLSSVQCYNIMNRISENDLINLEQFTQYGRFALRQSNGKPFQSLLFIVRDWLDGFETDYGWSGTEVISEILKENRYQSAEMRERRVRFRSNFDEIRGFLLPSPGRIVAEGNDFTGNLQQIDEHFLRYVEQLAPEIFAPENLIVKKINGKPVRARDLMQFFQIYIKIFNGGSLPEPKSLTQASIEMSNQIVLENCIEYYNESMARIVASVETYHKIDDLLNIHEEIKLNSIIQFRRTPKLGSEEIVSNTEHRLKDEMEELFQYFRKQNDARRSHFTNDINRKNNIVVHKIKVGPTQIPEEDFVYHEVTEEPEPKEEPGRFRILPYCLGAVGGFVGFYLGGPMGMVAGIPIGIFFGRFLTNDRIFGYKDVLDKITDDCC